MNRAEKFLAHYSSPYYDPMKAHAYYEEHKKLSDKAAATALTSKAQRDTFAVSKENITKAKTAEVTKDQKAEAARLKDLQAKATATAKSITESLHALAQQLKNDTAHVKVNEIPANATPKQRAFLENQNRILRANAAQANQKTLSIASGQAGRDRHKVVADLSTAITKARKDYAASMKALQTRYTNITANEKQHIHDQIAGAPPKPAVSAHIKRVSKKALTKK